MNEIYKNTLDLESFSHMLDDTVECYKFYWLDSILDLLAAGKDEMTFEDIINGMIASAWYSVGEYHLHLGRKNAQGDIMNNLERAVAKLLDAVSLKNDASSDDVIMSIKENESLIHTEKIKLTENVPYRLLSSFFKDIGGNNSLWNHKARMIAYMQELNAERRLPYMIIDGVGLSKKVVIDDIWKAMLIDNFVQVKGWIKSKKVRYLQDKNPGVPGIVYKLEPENEKLRKLNNVRKLWSAMMEVKSVIDIYSQEPLEKNAYDVDHFIPWTYIASDELWNLMPIDKRLNNSKNNKLPKWNEYFQSFAANQYMLYDAVFNKGEFTKQFDNCQRDNLASLWATEELYISGISEFRFRLTLEEHLKPIYDSARVQGYRIWDYSS